MTRYWEDPFPWPLYPDAYFDDAMADLVTVDTGRSVFYAPLCVFEDYFPAVAQHAEQFGYISIPILAGQLQSIMGHRVALKRIMNVLKSVVGNFKKSGIFSGGLTRPVCHLLETQLGADIYQRHPGGLRQARSCFLTLAVFARANQSAMLAEALIQFFLSDRRSVVSHERTANLRDWMVGIFELIGLVSQERVNRAMLHLLEKRDKIHTSYRNSGLHDPHFAEALDFASRLFAEHYRGLDYDRGRSTDRRFRYFPDIPRANTVPPRLHAHHRIPLLLPQTQNHLVVPGHDIQCYGLPSPSPSMDMALGGAYMGRDEVVENLAMRQNILEDQVKELKWQVGSGYI
jgi:hypothetical protein